MSIEKPKRLSLVEQVTKQIEKLIQQGYWKVGERLPAEKELMQQFDVSRNTLREAIRALVHVGLLMTKQGSGTVVTSTSALDAVLTNHIKHQSLLQILEVRSALESEAAYLAAKRRTNADISKMSEHIKACERAFAKNDVENFLQADFQFHQTIVSASQNSILIDLYASLNDSLYYSIEQNIEDLERNKDENHIHYQLFIAIQLQNANKASQIVKDYLLTMKRQILKETEES